ncbi:PD-(D/E)XK nuclease family protein [Patescibacteria group bacterium]|nr:PD-(D/E)XK nuclease family protein [Patescibacteria group bacterium]
MAEYTKKYNPNRSAEWNYGGDKWKLSRSKIDFFIECPRCFYIDNKLGTKRPGMPSFNLNIAVDELFKKEFDSHRAAGTKHPLMKKYNIDAVPFAHKDLDTWRDPFVGLMYTDPETGLVVSGGIDDVWQHSDGSLIVVDYKATSKDGSITSLADSAWEEQYERQIGIYQWLFEKMGFTVHKTGYFVYANALKTADGFNDTLTFETTVIPCTGDNTWLPNTLQNIKKCLDSDEYPESGPKCEYCPYRAACGQKLQAIHGNRKEKIGNGK